MGSPGDLPEGQNWLIARHPDDHRALENRRGAGRLATLDELEIALDDLPEGEMASCAAPLATLDRENEAEALMVKVNWSKLSPIEAALLKELAEEPLPRGGKNCAAGR
jgi:hypothetical protein